MLYLIKIAGLNNVVWSRHVNQIRRKVNYNSHPINVRNNQNIQSAQNDEFEGNKSNNLQLLNLIIKNQTLLILKNVFDLVGKV